MHKALIIPWCSLTLPAHAYNSPYQNIQKHFNHSSLVLWSGWSSSGFDHQHPEVYEHCKRLLLHLLVVQGTNSSVQSLASVLLRNREINDPKVLTVKPALQEFNLTGKRLACCLQLLHSLLHDITLHCT